MDVRTASPTDADNISALIKSVARFFTLHPQGVGAEEFLRSIEPDAIRGYIAAPNFMYWAAFENDSLAGVVAVRDASHLYHLFVGEAFQRRGLARQLWEHARNTAMAAGNHDRMTVNSTPFAVPVYERFGFTTTGPRVETKGIA